MFHTPDQAPLRGTSTPDKEFGFYDSTVEGGWQIPGEPYSNASEDKEQRFWWWRARMLGGRTNHWGRISLRNGPYDFKPHARDGLGIDWPLDYEDVAPYYDKVEMLIGVYGDNDGMENTPNSSPGVLLPPPKPRAGEMLIGKNAKKLGVPVVAAHRAVLSQKLDHERLPKLLHPGNERAQKIVGEHMRSRQACFWATDCGRGCSILANYQSTTVHLPPAMATGNLDIITQAMVREVELDKRGRATGVVFIDKESGKEHRAKARVIVLAASACESVRIMLNSKSTRFPQGLANSSGKVGKYLMDTVGSPVTRPDPAAGKPAAAQRGRRRRPARLLAVVALQGAARRQARLRARLSHRDGHRASHAERRQHGGAGELRRRLRPQVQGRHAALLRLVHRLVRARRDDSERGLVLRDRSRRRRIAGAFRRCASTGSGRITRREQAAHMQKTFAAIIEEMGGKVIGKSELDGRKAIAPGGFIIHEIGGAIMGTDPKKSVTNQWMQSWDVKNLFITDGAPFPSNADKNPTLTIMALAWRSADYMLQAMKRREL